MTREDYTARLSGLTRAELLKLCRSGGLAAHKLATNGELIELLWKRFGVKLP